MAPEIQVGVHERWAGAAAPPPFSHKCVQFKGIRSRVVRATAEADYSHTKKYKGWYFIQRPDSCRLSGWYREAWLGTYLHNTGVWPRFSPASSLPVGAGRWQWASSDCSLMFHKHTGEDEKDGNEEAVWGTHRWTSFPSLLNPAFQLTSKQSKSVMAHCIIQMVVIKLPALVWFFFGVLVNSGVAKTGPWEMTASVPARTLITVTLLSSSACLRLKQTLLLPPRATSIVIVTKDNHTRRCCRGNEQGRNLTFTDALGVFERIIKLAF